MHPKRFPLFQRLTSVDLSTTILGPQNFVRVKNQASHLRSLPLPELPVILINGT